MLIIKKYIKYHGSNELQTMPRLTTIQPPTHQPICKMTHSRCGPLSFWRYGTHSSWMKEMVCTHSPRTQSALTKNKYWQRLNVCKQQVKNGAELENHKETHTQRRGEGANQDHQIVICMPTFWNHFFRKFRFILFQVKFWGFLCGLTEYCSLFKRKSKPYLINWYLRS